MAHDLNRVEAAILTGCVATLAANEKLPAPSGYGQRAEKRRAWDTQRGLVEVNAALWAGIPRNDTAARMACSRAYASLERRGLVERVCLNGRGTSHLKPTAAGKALVAARAERNNTCQNATSPVGNEGSDDSQDPAATEAGTDG